MNPICLSSSGRRLVAIAACTTAALSCGGAVVFEEGAGGASGRASGTGASGPTGKGVVTLLDRGSDGPRGSAVFSDTASLPGCTDRVVTSCRVRTCDQAASNPIADELPPAPTATAGAITFSGIGDLRMVLEPQGSAGYPPGYSFLGTSWMAGQAITISAAGDPTGVPSFTGQVMAPATATVNPPTAIHPGMGASLTWSGGSGDVTVGVWGGAGAASLIVLCTFPAASGMGVIPPEALSDLLATPQTASVFVKTSADHDLMVGGWAVTLRAARIAYMASINIE